MFLFSGSHEDADREKQRQQARGRCTTCIFPLDYVSRHKTKLPFCVCEVLREWHTHELLLEQTHNKDEINALSAAYRWTSGLRPWYQHYLLQPGNSGHSTSQWVSWCDAQNKTLPGHGGGLRTKQTKQGSFQNDSLLKLNNSDIFAAWDQVALDSSPCRSTVERQRTFNATIWNLFR